MMIYDHTYDEYQEMWMRMLYSAMMMVMSVRLFAMPRKVMWMLVMFIKQNWHHNQ
jgi:hypothetical protein